ncbi:MAG: ATP-binding protein [Chthoniobacteraceae bacterium]
MDPVAAIAGGISQGSTDRRARELFDEHKKSIHLRTDRMFAWLMPLQWLAGVAVALWLSPKTWAGQHSSIHPHLLAAIFLGGAITFWPVFCAIMRSGTAMTAYVIAIGQMLMSALIIHLSGGRIEAHFHVFGSLAFIAFYRDWRVLVSASIVVALDHFVRGIYFPLSVFGALTVSPFRWLEHAGWVIFEDVFLLISIRQSLAEMLGIAERQAALETVNSVIEQTVIERTSELTKEIVERKAAEIEVERMNKELLDISRRAGMAEVATNVLHNVGNVLNSVNVSHTLISDKVLKSRIGGVAKTANLLKEHAGDIGAFFTTNPAGQKVPDYLGKLGELLSQEQGEMLKELQSLGKNIDHIKEIVAVQQSYANVSGVREMLPLETLVEDALRMNTTAMVRHNIEVIRDYGDVPAIAVEKHKVLQILVNLVSNAKYSLGESGRDDKRLTLRVARLDDHVIVSVTDNGVGIPPENLTRIFAHGFTTKKTGHGFGLHGGVLAAREMGGDLTVASDGPGNGAVFTLHLPANAEVKGAERDSSGNAAGRSSVEVLAV